MDAKTLEKGRQLQGKMEKIRGAMDEWEKQEIPLTPDRLRMSPDCFEFTLADVQTWKAFRRASIDGLQRQYDQVADEFKRL